MNGRIFFGVAALAVLGALVASAALATPPTGLMASLLARGSAGEFTIHDKSQKLKLQTKGPLDVAIVRATLRPRAENPPNAAGVRPLSETGWHGHAAPSLLVVQAGSLTVSEVRRGECVVATYGAGQAFVHTEDPHNGVAGPEGAEFYIVYLLPEGASPAAIDVTPAPAACS
jgi:hypothetical protein